MASSSSSGNIKTSRFSTFKAFGNKFSHKDRDELKPPPPPPKDPYYLYNRSLVSLSPDSMSLPNTPSSLFPYPQKPSPFPHPNSSVISLVSSSASSPGEPSSSSGTRQRKSDKLTGFFKPFKRSSSRSPAAQSPPPDPPEPQPDDNISMPWNFQHHIHVDEGYSGLPPSWTASLANLGYKEDEIAAIQEARRSAGSRSPASFHFPDRPRSPALSVTTTSSGAYTTHTSIRPAPRTTSLPRKYSDASLPGPPPPPPPRLAMHKLRSSSPSTSSLSSVNTTPSTRKMAGELEPPAGHLTRARNGSMSSQSISDSDPPPDGPSNLAAASPKTPPPKRKYVVANETPSTRSPPPAYTHSTLNENGYPIEKRGHHQRQASTESAGASSASSHSSKRRSKMTLTGLPPRLSLYGNDDNDLTLWSEALLSSIPSELSTAKPPLPERPPAPTRTIPPPVIVQDEDDQEEESPMWEELQGMGEPPSSARWKSPALSESLSPTLPVSPGKPSPYRTGSSGLKSEWAEDLEEEEDEEEDEKYLSANGRMKRDSSRYSSRSSTSTVSTVTVTHGVASIARRAVANVIEEKPRVPARMVEEEDSLPLAPVPNTLKQPVSPMSSHFGSEEGSGSGSGSSSSQSQDHHQTPTMDTNAENSLLYYAEPSPEPSDGPFAPQAHRQIMDTYAAQKAQDALNERQLDLEDDEEEEEDFEDAEVNNVMARTHVSSQLPRPTIVISSATVKPGPFTAAMAPNSTPITPGQRYRGWLSGVVKPLEEFIDEPIDPREYYLDLQEIAEGESGSVFVARVAAENHHKLKLPPMVKAKDADELAAGRERLVAIKVVAIMPAGSPKLDDLRHELTLLKGLMHPNVLSLDALYVDLAEDSLWIRMALMERSLADVIQLVDEGLILQERTIARLASDALEALVFLQSHQIAHRDVRSDNLLLNRAGELKLTDFSNAVQLKGSPLCADPVGVPYWQAPEVRSGTYNALKIDVWSVGATVWEMAQAEPPFQGTQQFGDRWPPLSQPELYSPAFHEFLRLCSEPATTRPDAKALTKNAFINNACGRAVIQLLLTQCTNIEQTLQEQEEYQESDPS